MSASLSHSEIEYPASGSFWSRRSHWSLRPLTSPRRAIASLYAASKALHRPGRILPQTTCMCICASRSRRRLTCGAPLVAGHSGQATPGHHAFILSTMPALLQRQWRVPLALVSAVTCRSASGAAVSPRLAEATARHEQAKSANGEPAAPCEDGVSGGSDRNGHGDRLWSGCPEPK